MEHAIKTKDLADRIKKAREQRGWSQQKLADRMNLDSSAISLIEDAKRSVKADELVLLSMFLERPVSYFLGEEEVPDLRHAVRSDPDLSQDDKRTILHIVDLAKSRGKRLPRRPE
jgi:transcriptional regulator with XRE-family HTH domain